MAELAKEYHSSLQGLGIDDNREAEREVAINETVDQIKTAVDPEQQAQLSEECSALRVREALKLTKNNSAPGLDGVPYELYKTIIRQCDDDRKAEKETFDMLTLMAAAFNDIARFGIVEGSDFSD
ncbi:hypothetical protein EV361DRAFT_828384, partial [Lentinula raphanica]